MLTLRLAISPAPNSLTAMFTVAVAAAPEREAVTVNGVDAHAEVGVPEITPVVGLKLKPGQFAPEKAGVMLKDMVPEPDTVGELAVIAVPCVYVTVVEA